MATYSVSIDSPLSAEEAFAYVADFRNFEAWDPGVSSSVQVTEPTTGGSGPGLGAEYEVQASRATLIYRVETYEPPTEVYVEATTRFFSSRDRITVAASGTGSVVTYDAILELNGPLGLADPLLGAFFDRLGDKAATGLATALGGIRR